MRYLGRPSIIWYNWHPSGTTYFPTLTEWDKEPGSCNLFVRVHLSSLRQIPLLIESRSDRKSLVHTIPSHILYNILICNLVCRIPADLTPFDFSPLQFWYGGGRKIIWLLLLLLLSYLISINYCPESVVLRVTTWKPYPGIPMAIALLKIPKGLDLSTLCFIRFIFGWNQNRLKY